MKYDCSYDELVHPSKLVPHPRNNNRHPIEQINKFAEILKAIGVWRYPIVVSKKSGFIISGHGRLEVALKLNLDKVPVNYQTFENEAEEVQQLTLDNEIARWTELDRHAVHLALEELPDLDIELMGIENWEMPEVEVEGKTDEDAVPEVKHDPVTKRGDVWLLGNHRVMCGDSTMIDDVEDLMKGEKADVLLTDPPYNYGKETHCSKKNTGKNQLKSARWDKNFKPNNVPFIDFLNDSFSAYIFTSAFLFGETLLAVKELSDFSGMMCWKKTTYNSNLIKRHPTWNIEPIVYATRGNHVFNYDSSDSKNALLEFAGEHCTRFYGHPSQKPVKMLKSITENSSMPNSLALDLFLGSGSTLIACEKTNRKCYGMELDEHYCDVVINRWQDFTGKDAVLESTGESYNQLTGKTELARCM